MQKMVTCTLLMRRKRLALCVTVVLLICVVIVLGSGGGGFYLLQPSKLRSLARWSRLALPNPKRLCPLFPPLDSADVALKLGDVTYDEVARELRQFLGLGPGGHYAPSECRARERVAVIIPMRDRKRNLYILLRNLLPFLARQQAEFSVFLVEQTEGSLFNKGVMIDVGYVKARESGVNFTCFVVQDTDLIPRDYRNLYRCGGEGPRHLMMRRSGEMRPVEWRMPYLRFFGGAVAMREEHFNITNGYSTAYYGWGWEDDDMEMRFRTRNISISRFPIEYGNYYELGHDLWERGPRAKLKQTAKARMETDGLNNLTYTLVREEHMALYHHYLVTPPPPPPHIYGSAKERGVWEGKGEGGAPNGSLPSGDEPLRNFPMKRMPID